jgi:hypothetical protein
MSVIRREDSREGRTNLGYRGERTLALEHGVGSRHLNQSVSFGAVVALAASHLNTLHLRSLVERMLGCRVVTIDHEACEVRVGTQVHVEHLDILGRVPCQQLCNGLRTSRTARHNRPTPRCRIQSPSRSTHSLAVALVLHHKVIVVPNLDIVPELRARPNVCVTHNRGPSDILWGLNDFVRTHVFAVAIPEVIFLQKRPREPRLIFSWDEDDDATHVDRGTRSGKGLEAFAQALVRRPVGLLAFEGAVADVFAGAAELGRYFCAAWADVLSLFGLLCRRHDGGGDEVVDVGVLMWW